MIQIKMFSTAILPIINLADLEKEVNEWIKSNQYSINIEKISYKFNDDRVFVMIRYNKI